MGCNKCDDCSKCKSKCLMDDSNPFESLAMVLSLMLPTLNSDPKSSDNYNNLVARVEMLETELDKMKKLLLR